MRNRIFAVSLLLLAASLFLPVLDAGATPLLSMQAADSCDNCHQMPDKNDPKWVEANYQLWQRKCGLHCNTCHVNPDGGMLRSDGGFYYGTKKLPLSPVIAEEIQRALQVVRGNKFLNVGGDFRFADLITNQDGKHSPLFFPMQGDLYAAAQLGGHVTFITQFGLERNQNAAVREVFGMVDRLPYNSYIKVGKFVPPFGHRLDDHTALVRRELYLDHSTPAAYPVGVEVGADPLTTFFRASYFNDDVTPIQNTSRTPHGYSAVAGWHGLWLQLGASYLSEYDVDKYPGFADRTAYGVFGGVELWRFSWLFEVDARHDELVHAVGEKDTTSYITFNELNYKIVRGLTAKVRFESYDPDKDIDKDEENRYMVGFDFHPFPLTEVDAQYRFNETPQEDFWQTLVMIHLWF